MVQWLWLVLVGGGGGGGVILALISRKTDGRIRKIVYCNVFVCPSCIRMRRGEVGGRGDPSRQKSPLEGRIRWTDGYYNLFPILCPSKINSPPVVGGTHRPTTDPFIQHPRIQRCIVLTMKRGSST
jgi:pimeloyl-ACP methyl ester carboxylesterase